VDAETKVAEAEACCANCGIAGVDNVKLEECDDCGLVRYCGDKCRDDHREEHEEECMKRQALLHDRKLFTQPDRAPFGECPICFLPMPLDTTKSLFYPCCSKLVCLGCVHANYMSTKHNLIEALRCPFCREPGKGGEEKRKKNLMMRVKANDPIALRHKGKERYDEDDYNSAFEYWTKATEVGDVHSHYNLSLLYGDGLGVEKDEEKEVFHLEKAAIGGNDIARCYLAAIEEKKGNMERAVKHAIIAANLGNEESMKDIWGVFKAGCITKEDLAAILRTHQAAVDAMKSPQRKIADEVFRGLLHK
jgi:hypothetical protein